MTNAPSPPPDPALLVEALRAPRAYPGDVEEVGFLQTHASWLFFAGERVYKVKKPVDLGFLDFTTLARRKHFSEEELRLNRRLAPDVYLGVVPIVRDAAGSFRVQGAGEVVEWAVEMRRLPAHRMLAALLERGEIDNQKMNALAELLVPFHARAASGPGVDEHGSPAAIAANALANFDALEPFVRSAGATDGAQGGTPEWLATPRQLAFLRARCRAFLADMHGFLRSRMDEGRIRDGHGDLHAGNVCFEEQGVVAYDCIEFEPAFRCGDVAGDLAFLAMDLDARGYPGFARYFVRACEELGPDPGLPVLIGFYKGYRALVRAKVAALTMSGAAPESPERQRARLEGMHYLQLASGYELGSSLLLLCGLPGSGKSFLAHALARTLRAPLLQSDVRRKRQAGRAPSERAGGGYGEGLYAPERREEAYRSLLEDALRLLDEEQSVVVDATFSRRDRRAPFVEAALRLERPFLVVQVTCPESVVLARLERRASDPAAISDAGPEVYRRERERFEPPIEVTLDHAIEVRGDAPVEEAVALVIEQLVALQGG